MKHIQRMRQLLVSRAARMLLGAGLICALLLLAFSTDMLLRYQRYQSEIDRMMPRMAQIKGIQDAQQQIETAVAVAADEVARYVYPGAADDAALNSELQNKVRSAFTDAGMQVSGSQILPARPAGSVSQLLLDLTAVGSLEALETALGALKQAQPVILVDSLRIEPVINTRADRTQSVQVNVRVSALKGAGR